MRTASKNKIESKLAKGKLDSVSGVVKTELTSITEGKVDMGLAALCATEERKKVMNFSDTYFIFTKIEIKVLK